MRGQQKKFITARTSDYILAPLIAAALSLVGAYLVGFLGFLTVFAAPFFGLLIVRAVQSVTKNRRSNSLFMAASAAAAVGSLPLLVYRLLPMLYSFSSGGFNIYSLFPLLWQGLYSILVTGAVYYRLKGISL